MRIATIIMHNGRAIRYDHECSASTPVELERFVADVSNELKAQGQILIRAKTIWGDTDNSNSKN